MSIPRKHHFIHQVHIEQFRKAESFRVYDKFSIRVFSKKYTHDLFQVKDSNVIIDENGELNYDREELFFSDKYESKFNDFKTLLSEFIHNRYTEDLNKLIADFFLDYAISVHHRALRVQEEYITNFPLNEHQVIKDLMWFFNWSQIFNIPIFYRKWFKRQIRMYKANIRAAKEKLKVPVPNLKDTSSILIKDYYLEIFIDENESFVLPDCGSLLWKNVHAKHVHHDQLARVLLPVSKGIVLRFTRTDLSNGDGWISRKLDREEVEYLNGLLKHGAYRQYIGF